MTTVRVVLLLSLVLIAPVARAQAPAGGGRPVRVVLAGGRLASVVDAPLFYRINRITLAGGQTSAYTGPASMIYGLTGGADVAVDGERSSLREGAATFVPASRPVTLSVPAGSGATLLQFVLATALELDRAMPASPAVVTEVHRTSRAIPGLKPGPYEFTMTRVSVERGSPRPPMHYRSGAAIYYVLAGTWSLHEDGGKLEARARGAVQFEPNDFVHSWQNMGDASGILLQANISPEGSPEIIFLPPR
jgi:quercetin dioxygenase-like cupin family protein